MVSPELIQQPAILIPLLPVIFQLDRIALYHLPGESGCFVAIILNRCIGAHRFRGIYADEPDLFAIAQDDGITVNYPGAYEAISIGTGRRKKQDDQEEGKQDA